MYSVLGLPVDLLLGTTSASLPQLPLPLGISPAIIAKTAGPSVVISVGIPPISMKWAEKIRQREFIDLSKSGSPTRRDHHYNRGALVSVESATRLQRKTIGISDILSWLNLVISIWVHIGISICGRSSKCN